MSTSIHSVYQSCRLSVTSFLYMSGEKTDSDFEINGTGSLPNPSRNKMKALVICARLGAAGFGVVRAHGRSFRGAAAI